MAKANEITIEEIRSILLSVAIKNENALVQIAESPVGTRGQSSLSIEHIIETSVGHLVDAPSGEFMDLGYVLFEDRIRKYDLGFDVRVKWSEDTAPEDLVPWSFFKQPRERRSA